MPDYATTAPLPGWPTEPEYVSPREQAPAILPPGYTYGVGSQGQLVAVPVQEQAPASFMSGPAPSLDVWPKRMLCACPLVATTGAASWFVFHALAAAEGSLIALAVLGAMIWASVGSSGKTNVSVSVSVAPTMNIHNRNSVRGRR